MLHNMANWRTLIFRRCFPHCTDLWLLFLCKWIKETWNPHWSFLYWNEQCKTCVVVVVCIDYAGVECMNTGVDVMNKVYFPALFGACPCWCISAHALCAILRSSGEGWLLEHAWIMWSEMCEFRTLVWNSQGTLSSFQVLFTENDEILSAPSVHIRVVIFETKTNNQKSTRKKASKTHLA